MSDHIAVLDGPCNGNLPRGVVRFPTSADILRDARMTVLSAYVTGGHTAALAAIGAGSVRLARLVDEDALLWRPARAMLIQVASNLKLPQAFGRRAVHVAINAGPNLFDEMAEAAQAA